MQSTTRLIGLMFLLSAAGAGAETINCTEIAKLPYIITAPGIYCLQSDLSTDIATGAAIEVAADDVVLDLNRHALDGSAAGASTEAYGVYAFDRKNITLRNGTIRGFVSGVLLNGATAGGTFPPAP